MRLTPGQQDGDQAPLSICECMDLRVAPAARAANSLFLLPPFPPDAERWAFTCVELIIWVSVDRPRPASSRSGLSKCRARPNARSGYRVSSKGRTRAGNPATAFALEHLDDPADHAPVVLPLDTAHIRRRMEFYPFPLLIAQPKQVLAHDPDPQDKIKPYEVWIVFPQQQN